MWHYVETPALCLPFVWLFDVTALVLAVSTRIISRRKGRYYTSQVELWRQQLAWQKRHK